MTPRYSLVIPICNEAGNLLPLLERTVPVLAALPAPHEIILIDDGSRDATPAEIRQAVARWPQLRVLTHAQNLGQATALLAGLQAARGEIILTMDGDGQNDPTDFPLLLGPVEAGTLDLACGWRHDRHDSAVRRILSRIGNLVRSRLLGDGLHDGGCQLRVFRRALIAELFPFEMLQAFVPAIAVAAGYRIGEFRVRHHPRVHGAAHFGLRQLWWRPACAMLRLRRHLQRR